MRRYKFGTASTVTEVWRVLVGKGLLLENRYGDSQDLCQPFPYSRIEPELGPHIALLVRLVENLFASDQKVFKALVIDQSSGLVVRLSAGEDELQE